MTLTEPQLRALRNIRNQGIPFASTLVTRALKRGGYVIQDDDKWWLTEAGHAAIGAIEQADTMIQDALTKEEL